MTRETEVMVCGSCRFFNAIRDEEGQCRRHAPRPIPWEVLFACARLATDADEPQTESAFPTVSIDEWCGEFEFYREQPV